MMRFRNPLVCLGLLLGAIPAFAQGPSIEPPIADRPPDYSNIVGKYAITVTAEPTEVDVEEPITLRLVITGSGPEKFEPKREDLRLFPAWDDDFYVQEMRDEHVAARDKQSWLFVYRLRPKHTKVNAIDGIKFVYYDPSIPGKKKFVTRFVDRIPIAVKPKPDTASTMDLSVVATPDSFYRLSDAGAVLIPATAPRMISTSELTIALLAPPLACFLGMHLWRRSFPDAGERKLRQRSRAAKRAVAALQGGDAPAWSVVGEFLRERFDLQVLDPTTGDVADFLKRRGFAIDLCGRCRAFFQTCDAVLYTSGSAPQNLRDDAIGLIHALEADPCVRV